MAEALFSSASGGSDSEREQGGPEMEDSEESYRRLCEHYSRGCSFVSPCCGKIYHCRLCHDQQETHKIDRHAITQIICRRCSIRQPVANYCCNCTLQFGLYYFCAICNFHDDTNNGQFHCEKCGICRARGKENFFHCDKCGFCLALERKENHTCRQDISKNNCPICFEDIHTSRDPAHVPRCGHVLHSTCFKGLMQKGLYQCPQCQTSLVDMRQTWERLDAERESWVMPQQLRNFRVKIHCRDCNSEGDTFYHIAGLKCGECGSYNTVRTGCEELPAVGTAVLNRYRRGDWRNRRRRSRHRQEREELEQQLQAAEHRAAEAERKLKEMEHKVEQLGEKVVAAEHRAELAEEKAARAEQATSVAQRRTEMAEEQVIELERKLFETENDLEELLVRDTERMALETSSGQSSSKGSGLNILRTSCNSLSGYYMPDQQGLNGEQQEGTGDELSITSL